MRHLLLAIGLLILFQSSAFTQEIKLKEYSFSEFFQMIAVEEDSVFSLSNAFIKFNKKTDQKFILKSEFDKPYNLISPNKDSIRVDKTLELTNIVIESYATANSQTPFGIGKVVFTKPIQCTNCLNFFVGQSAFISTVTFRFNRQIRNLESLLPEIPPPILFISGSNFQSGIEISGANFRSGFEINTVIDKRNLDLIIFDNVFNALKEKNERITILGAPFQYFMFNNNLVEGSADLTISTEPSYTYNQSNERLSNLEIKHNEFKAPTTRLSFNDQNTDFVTIIDNQWSGTISASISELDRTNTVIEGSGLLGKLIDDDTYREYVFPRVGQEEFYRQDFYTQKNLDHYRQKQMIEDVNTYNSEVALRGLFKSYFDKRHDAVSANQFYIEIKDLETRRLAYLYHQNPSFDGFFKWRINQFLKMFSAYGTEPAKAITFSVYVILAFAIVYLFFPNYWDSHGKDRILNRYQFFLKYLNKDAGMHDVYLEDKKDELAHYEGFRLFFEENGKTVPKFFLATALPLYRWSIASTRGTSWFLQKIDIFKGKWSDLPPTQRVFKTILLVIVFIVAILYDLFIKALNALMLSINTFTTLGFGEIPIKGLPRYLAIIQGFIGWFMLTIFSVSLISQLLN